MVLTVLDCDQNAGINLMQQFFSLNALWSSYQLFLRKVKKIDNLRHIAHNKLKVSSSNPRLRFDGLVGSPLLMWGVDLMKNNSLNN